MLALQQPLPFTYEEPPAPRPRTLEQIASDLLRDLVQRFPLGYQPELVWRNLRVTAGLAYYRERRIVLSRKIITDEDRLTTTLKHEYAHLLAVARHGLRAAGHGKAWKQAMRDLGIPPQVRHVYDVQRNQPRQEVVYRCLRCGETLVRARRLAKRRRWYHATCGGSLRLIQVVAVSPRSDVP